MGLYEKLFDWQKNIVNKIKEKESYGLFLDMGLGKTIVALSLAEINKCEKVIIVSINSKAEETEKDSGSWLAWAKESNMNYDLYTKKRFFKSKGFTDKPELAIINYESLFNRTQSKEHGISLKEPINEFVKSCKGKRVAIILDESHKIKDSSSLQSKAISKLKMQLFAASSKTYLYLATGTPFTKGLIDLYNQLKLLGCQLTKTQFIDNYCVRGYVPGLLGWQQPIIAYKNVDELYDLVHQYAITIKSEEVVDLPQQIFVRHKMPVSDSFKLLTLPKLSKKLNEKFLQPILHNFTDIPDDFKKKGEVPNPFYRNMAFPKEDWFAETSASFWLRTRQIGVGFQGNEDNYEWYDKHRIEELKKFLETNEDNYVVFYNYTPELFELFKVFEELDYNIDIYCGKYKNIRYYEKYEKQSESERLTNKKNVIIANFASGSTGKNWQLYNKCIIFSIPVYRDYEQGIKRIHRIGSKEPVFYHIFYQDNWLDESMLKSLEEKKDYSKDMFESDLKIYGTRTEDTR